MKRRRKWRKWGSRIRKEILMMGDRVGIIMRRWSR
jgi:hypothetical protein